MPPLPDDPEYAIHPGDCIPHMTTMPAAASTSPVFSPPFPSLYRLHSHVGGHRQQRGLTRRGETTPLLFYHAIRRDHEAGPSDGRPRREDPPHEADGGRGLFDFRGINIRLGERAGLVFEYDWMRPQESPVPGDPHEEPGTPIRPAWKPTGQEPGGSPRLPAKFRAAGEKAVTVVGRRYRGTTGSSGLSRAGHRHPRDRYAERRRGPGRGRYQAYLPAPARGDRRLDPPYTTPGEIVFSPFAGIGSEVYMALKLGRRGYGCEIKPEYHATAMKNAERAIRKRDDAQSLPLFDTAGVS